MTTVRKKLVIEAGGTAEKSPSSLRCLKYQFPEVYVSTSCENYVADIEGDGRAI